jgi:hypothetical protein
MWDKEMFWPVNDRRVTDGTHETSVQLPLTFKYFSYSVWTLVCQCRRNVRQVSVARMLELASYWCKLHVSKVFLKRSKEMKITGHKTVGVWEGLSISYQPYCCNQSQVQLAVRPSSFHFYELLNKKLADKQFETCQCQASCHLAAMDTGH